MADVVRSGAIFRVRDASATKAPRASPRTRSSNAATPSSLSSTRVRRVVVSALEAASSVESARPSSSSSARRHTNGGGARAAPGLETPAGMPKRKARLQQTPTIHSARKSGGLAATAAAAAAGRRTPEEIRASFDQLVRTTTAKKHAATATRKASNNVSISISGNRALVKKRRTRSQSVSSSSSSVSASAVESTPVSSRHQHRHLTRSAAKAQRLQQQRQYAPAATSPASSVTTLVLESTEEEPEDLEDDEEGEEAKQKTPPTKRKSETKRARAKESEVPTSVRSSKRLRAQLRIPGSLPPVRSTPIAQVGNTKEDEELLQIQKRLVFGSRKPKAQRKQQQQQWGSSIRSASTSENSTAEEEEEEGEEPAKATLPRSSPRKRSDQKQRLSASFSILEDVEALPKSKTKSGPTKQKSAASTSTKKAASRASSSSSRSTSKFMLCDWTPQWPPVYERPEGSGDQKEQLQLVLEGQVLGHDATFQVLRRVSATYFISTANEHVELDGCLDVEKAKAWGVPAAVIEIMVDGLPALWRRKLDTTLNKKMPKAATRRKTKASEEEEESDSEPEEEGEPGTKRSRSGRMITPVMDWWRGERLLTDVNGVTVVAHGSPAFIPSPSKKAAAKRSTTHMSSVKPPRTPVASKTPVKAKTPIAKTKQAIKDSKAQDDDASRWSEEQLQALAEAKMQISTTATNFWAEVAASVPGKTANECRTKSFEEFASPTSRAGYKKKSSEAAAAAAGPASTTKIPTKIHRAGSNLFKKQVRQFVQQYEKKHVDDLFSNTTPSKSELQGAMGLDDIKSPAAPMDSSANMDDDEDDFVSGRELLEGISSNKRDEVDSYVLSLKRSRVLGEPTTSSSTSARTSFLTPSTLKKKAKSMKRTVHMYEEIGPHRVEGVVSPGGTTHVHVNKDSDATSDEEDERDSDEEHSSDGF